MKTHYKIWQQLQSSNYLTILLILNFTLFVVVNISMHILRLNIIPYLAVPLNDEYELLYKPWTLVTYMFLHTDVFHLLFNILLLYYTGTLFQGILGEKRLLYLYIMSGFTGVLFLFIAELMFPNIAGSYLMGASAAIMGIIAAQAMYTPDFMVNLFFVIHIPFKYFALIVFIFSTLLDFSFNTGGKLTHIGGAAFGILYAYYLKKGIDFQSFTIFKYSKKTDKLMKKRFKDEDEYLDYLLDKISTKGYHALSKEEKEDLFKISQKK